MNCIVIDDSANALELMKIYVGKIPFLNLMGSYQSALAALETINTNTVDLIFTDINMPDISGMQFIKSLNKDVMVIFTTAYAEYALEGYEVNAVDYLLKPISFDKFLGAAHKAYGLYKGSKRNMGGHQHKRETQHVLFKSGSDFQRVELNEILFLESKGNYMKVQLDDETHFLSLLTMKQALEKLKGGRFFRCHRGFIISLGQISKISAHEVKLGNHVIPVGKSYRSELQRLMGL